MDPSALTDLNPLPLLERAWFYFWRLPPAWILVGAWVLGYVLKPFCVNDDGSSKVFEVQHRAFTWRWPFLVAVPGTTKFTATKWIPLVLGYLGALIGAWILPWWIAARDPNWHHIAPTSSDRVKAVIFGFCTGALATALYDHYLRPLLELIQLRKLRSSPEG